MLAAIKNKRSLLFCDAHSPSTASLTQAVSLQNLGIAAVPVTHTVMQAQAVTMLYRRDLSARLNTLHTSRNRLNEKVAQGLLTDPHYQGARSDGVSLAWKYEQNDIAMGGKGSADWTPEERQEILQNGRLRQNKDTGVSPEGHHIKNVAAHPEEQANPDNIRFYKNREDHLYDGHGGDFQNASDGELIDKDAILRKTNTKRIAANEWRALGLSAAIGFGMGFTLSFIAGLARAGLSAQTVSDAAFDSAKAGLEMGTISAATHVLGRGAAEVLQNMGPLVNMAAIGVLSVAAISAYQCVKLYLHGELDGRTVSQIGRQASFSLSLLTVSIIAQGVWGGPAGLIVSTGAGLLFVVLDTSASVRQRRLEEKLRAYAVEQYKPILLGGS